MAETMGRKSVLIDHGDGVEHVTYGRWMPVSQMGSEYIERVSSDEFENDPKWEEARKAREDTKLLQR